jgi:hypothetical protein
LALDSCTYRYTHLELKTDIRLVVLYLASQNRQRRSEYRQLEKTAKLHNEGRATKWDLKIIYKRRSLILPAVNMFSRSFSMRTLSRQARTYFPATPRLVKFRALRNRGTSHLRGRNHFAPAECVSICKPSQTCKRIRTDLSEDD